MKKRLFIVFALTITVLISFGLTAGVAADKVYINGFDAAYPPFSFVDKNGKPAGFDIDSINWIAEEMGFKVKHQPTDWAAIVPSLKAKKIDLIASGMSITPERQAAVNFCNPYWQVIQLLAVKKDSKLTVDEALKPGRKIALLRGSAESKWMTKNQLKKGYKYELKFYDTTPLAIEDVTNGRADAAAVSNTALQEAMDRGLPVKSIGRYGQPDVNYGYAVRKEDNDFRNKLNEGLKRLKASPRWDELVKKWFANK
ncbi:MAG: amino acid ABC transporter substrate-binding protein [Deltaproteobacteria bacterium]|jgi:polar amino acid transport system substrate-binding protein|nr:amino acid ABC transporter substrate-binding protein [Deltaproteobacteria bacterium]